MKYRKDSFIRWYFSEREQSSIHKTRPSTESLRDKAVEFGYEFRELSVGGVTEHRIRWSQSGEWFTILDFITNHRSMIAQRAQSEVSRLNGLYPGAESDKKPKLLTELQSGGNEAYTKVVAELNQVKQQLEVLRKSSNAQLDRNNRFEDMLNEIVATGSTGPIVKLLEERNMLEKFKSNRRLRTQANS